MRIPYGAWRSVASKQMDLPNLSSLSLSPRGVRDRWLQACGTRPKFKSWEKMRGKHKYQMLHSVAASADDDTDPDGNYVSAYEQLDIDEVIALRRWSVEHVVPRSFINGSGPGDGEDDPNGWIEATRSANSQRSNHPLYLWPDPDGTLAPPNTLVRVDGKLHYVPPREQRARLARKWLFIRATYDDIQPPSTAQKRRASQIVALAQHSPVQPAEHRVNEHYRQTLDWANPLLEDGAERWYTDAAWRALVFDATGPLQVS